MDITTDGFGFMLAIGDLAWVPFTYTLQARYLAFHPVRLSPLSVIGIIATEATGYYIFRCSNWEKDAFRSGRNPRSESCSGRGQKAAGWNAVLIRDLDLDRPRVHADQEWQQALDFGLVGPIPTPCKSTLKVE